ncbi:hypothetical protein LAZ67_21000592 [Cordylochernes scorpioides]|uniref:Uncharacterized protein n=1 Tax=Cordylochernes scorpioides TaxID=51811 RepID=A0ABY6LLH4_9ARAC|nr:hypothetical protein LAZ67_21000592 [Cordylochernes scorpioides]
MEYKRCSSCIPGVLTGYYQPGQLNPGNEAADVLAKKDTKEPLPQKNKLTFKEIETIAKTKINKNWRIPPKHSWYSGVTPGGALNIYVSFLPVVNLYKTLEAVVVFCAAWSIGARSMLPFFLW